MEWRVTLRIFRAWFLNVPVHIKDIKDQPLIAGHVEIRSRGGGRLLTARARYWRWQSGLV